MRHSPKSHGLIRFFPVLVIGLVSILSIAGSWSTPQNELEARFRQAYGIIIDRLELMGLPNLTRSLASISVGQAGIPKSNLSLPAGYTATSTGGRLVFAQIADGLLPGTNRFYRTGFMLVNDSTSDAKGTLEFFDDAGKPQALTVEGVTASSFPVSVPKGTVRRYTTSGGGPLKVGWALVQTDQPVTGTSSFTILDATGKIFSDVGVPESFLGTSFTLFARYTAGVTDIGLALINPSSTDTISLKLELVNIDGTKKAETSLSLGPRAHIARFLAELYATTIGTDFTGTVVVSSANAKPFGGITLRITGNLYTSMPMVAPPKAGDSRTRLAFAQVADGLLGQLKYKTSILLFNNTVTSCSGSVEFYNSDGTPMTVTINGATAASHNFSIRPRGLGWLITSGAGNARVGWARVKMDQPMNGTGIFHVYDKADTALAEVGVAAATPSKSFNLIADSIGFFDTGIALANPSESSKTAKVTLNLYDKAGVLKSTANITLDPQKHQAQFLTQIFPGAANISEFEGLITAASDNEVVPLSLRSIDEKLTSVPTLAPVHGFAPDSVFQPLQSLAGSAPVIRWQLHQNGSDLVLRTAKVTAPALGLRSGVLAVGTEIGYGAFVMDLNVLQAGNVLGGVIKLISTKADGSEFDGLIAGPSVGNGKRVLTGKLSGSAAGNLAIEIAWLNPFGGTWNVGIPYDMDIFLHSEMISAPSAPGSIQVLTDYESISAKVEEDGVNILRKSIQPLSYIAADASKANLTAIKPVLLTPTTPVTIKGTNFGSSPQVIFSGSNGTTIRVLPIQNTADGLVVVVPEGVADGPVRIDNGTGPGNAFQAKLWFGPTLEVKRAVSGTGNTFPLAFNFQQNGSQLGLNDFQITITSVDRTLSGLAAGSVVGSYRVIPQNSTSATNEYDLVVDSSAADKAVLNVVKKGTSSSAVAKLTVQKKTDAPAGLTFSFAPTAATVPPAFFAYPVRSELVLSGLQVTLTVTGNADAGMEAVITSTPGGMAGMETALHMKISR